MRGGVDCFVEVVTGLSEATLTSFSAAGDNVIPCPNLDTARAEGGDTSHRAYPPIGQLSQLLPDDCPVVTDLPLQHHHRESQI